MPLPMKKSGGSQNPRLNSSSSKTLPKIARNSLPLPKSGSLNLNLTPNKDKMVYPEPPSRDRRGRGEHEARSRSRDRERGNSRRTGKDERNPKRLDQLVKKARESKDSHLNNRLLDMEDRDPNRWGHSGFKELYHQNSKRVPSARHSRSRSPRRSSYDRPRSGNNRERKSRSPSSSRFDRSSARNVQNIKKNNESPRLGRRDERNMPNSSNKSDRGKRSDNSSSKRKRSSSSESLNSLSKELLKKRSKAETKSIIERVREAVRGKLKRYPTSSSESDEDVLQLHPPKRRVFSSSSSSSTSSRSRSRSSAGKSSSSSIGDRRKTRSSSSSSTDSDDSAKLKPKLPDPKTSTLKTKSSKIKRKPTNVKPSEESTAIGKPQTSEKSKSLGSKARPSKPSVSKPETNPIRKGDKTIVVGKGESKAKNGSSETSSDSDSDDSDNEKKMSLTERFAKLSQITRDKRELNKPLLSTNQIDKSLKIIKDLTNPASHVKVFLDSPQPTQPSSLVKPKSPAMSARSEERISVSDDRRRHFNEIMSRDAPHGKIQDFSSNPRVRYEYYRDKGCFDARPLTLEEYIKWEQWYFEYKKWLEEEAYFQEMRLRQAEGRPPLGPQPLRLVESVGLSGRYPQMGQGRGYIGRRIGRAPGGSLVVNIRQNQGSQRGGRR